MAWFGIPPQFEKYEDGTSSAATWSNWSCVTCNHTTVASEVTWSGWASGTNATTNTYTMSADTWGSWVDSGSSGNYEYQPSTWVAWQDEAGEIQQAQIYPAAETEEQREAREVREVAQREMRERKAEEQRQANEKAEALLREFLTAEQKDMLSEENGFLLRSEHNKLYRIKRGRTGNVLELTDDGREVASYCIHPRPYLPNADTMLTQMLMLETAEDEFLRIANRTQRLRMAA